MNRSDAIVPDVFRDYENVVCAVSTRKGGVSPKPYGMNLSYRVGDRKAYVDRNREIFFRNNGIPPDRVSFQLQVHSDNSNYVKEVTFFRDSDALFTDVPGNYLALTIADCIPVFLFFPEGNFIAAIHSGWRSTNLKISYKTICRLKTEYGVRTDNCLAYIGPGISSENFQVSRDVYELFGEDVRFSKNGLLYVDLKKEIFRQLTEAGIKSSNIEVSPLCTYRDCELFHSYRRDGSRAGRMLGIIGLKG